MAQTRGLETLAATGTTVTLNYAPVDTVQRSLGGQFAVGTLQVQIIQLQTNPMQKLKPVLVLGMAIALIGLGFQASQKSQSRNVLMAQPAATPTPPPATGTKQRHRITLTVSDMGQVLVRRGQCVVAGQVMGDRQAERVKLNAKRRQLELALRKLTTNRPPPVPPEEPRYAVEEATIASARAQVAYWDSVPAPEYRFVDDDLIAYYERDVIQQRQAIQERRLLARVITLDLLG